MTADPRLRRKTIALVGLMGAGKSSIGRRLSVVLDLPFRDADSEVEAAAGRTISEIFESFGEEAFRDGERRVIARLMDEGPHVLATARAKQTASTFRLDRLARRVGCWWRRARC